MIGQLGGSIGIALLATLLQHSQQVHQAYLTTANLTDNRIQTVAALRAILAHLAGLGLSPAAAGRLSAALIENQITKQALFLSFRDVYAVVGVVALLLLIPIALFERGKSPEPS